MAVAELYLGMFLVAKTCIQFTIVTVYKGQAINKSSKIGSSCAA